MEQLFSSILTADIDCIQEIIARDNALLNVANENSAQYPDPDLAEQAAFWLGTDTRYMSPLQTALLILDMDQDDDELVARRRQVVDWFIENTSTEIADTHLWGRGNTTLHLASFLGDAEVVEKLMAKGVTMNVRNDLNFAPMDVADDEEVKELFKKHARPDMSPRRPGPKTWTKSARPATPVFTSETSRTPEPSSEKTETQPVQAVKAETPIEEPIVTDQNTVTELKQTAEAVASTAEEPKNANYSSIMGLDVLRNRSVVHNNPFFKSMGRGTAGEETNTSKPKSSKPNWVRRFTPKKHENIQAKLEEVKGSAELPAKNEALQQDPANDSTEKASEPKMASVVDIIKRVDHKFTNFPTSSYSPSKPDANMARQLAKEVQARLRGKMGMSEEEEEENPEETGESVEVVGSLMKELGLEEKEEELDLSLPTTDFVDPAALAPRRSQNPRKRRPVSMVSETAAEPVSSVAIVEEEVQKDARSGQMAMDTRPPLSPSAAASLPPTPRASAIPPLPPRMSRASSRAPRPFLSTIHEEMKKRDSGIEDLMEQTDNAKQTEQQTESAQEKSVAIKADVLPPMSERTPTPSTTPTILASRTSPSPVLRTGSPTKGKARKTVSFGDTIVSPSEYFNRGVLLLKVNLLQDLKVRLPKDNKGANIYIVISHAGKAANTRCVPVSLDGTLFSEELSFEIDPDATFSMELICTIDKPIEKKQHRLLGLFKRKKEMGPMNTLSNSTSMSSINALPERRLNRKASLLSIHSTEEPRYPRLEEGLIGCHSYNVRSLIKEDVGTIVTRTVLFTNVLGSRKYNNGSLRARTSSLFGSYWTNEEHIAKLELHMCYLPMPRCFNRSQMPSTIAQYADWLTKKSWHDKPFGEGCLSQRGGEIKHWKRRYYKLVGAKLTAYHEMNPDKFVQLIDLTNCVSVSDSFKNEEDEDLDEVKIPNGFRLEFADGNIIEFYADNAQEFSRWLEMLRHALDELKSHQIPVWWPAVSQIHKDRGITA